MSVKPTTRPPRLPGAPAGPVEIELPSLLVGEDRKLGLLWSEPGARVSSPATWTSSDPEILTIASTGTAYGANPGTAVVSVIVGPHHVQRPVTVKPVPPLPVHAEDQVAVTQGKVQQGLLMAFGRAWSSANLPKQGSLLYEFTMHFDLLRSRLVTPNGWPQVHVGSAAAWRGRILLATMEYNSYFKAMSGDASAVPALGLSVIDPQTLDEVDFFDLTGTFRYLDAVAVDGDTLWLCPQNGALVRMPLTDAGPDLTQMQRFNKTVRGVAQGMRVRDGLVYMVLENTSSNPLTSGLLVFDAATLVAAKAPSGLDHPNAPTGLHYVAYPSPAKPDLEAFDFDPSDPELAYISYIGSDSVVVLRLTAE